MVNCVNDCSGVGNCVCVWCDGVDVCVVLVFCGLFDLCVVFVVICVVEGGVGCVGDFGGGGFCVVGGGVGGVCGGVFVCVGG